MSEWISEADFFERVWSDGPTKWSRTEIRQGTRFSNPETGSSFVVPAGWVVDFDRYVRDLDPDAFRDFMQKFRAAGGANPETIRPRVLKPIRRRDFIRLLGYDPQGDGWTRLPDADGKAVYQCRRKSSGNTMLDVECGISGTRSQLDADGYRIYTITVPLEYVEYYTKNFSGLSKAEFTRKHQNTFRF